MADPVSLVFVDEDDLVGLRDRLCTASVLYVRAAIGEHQMRRRDAFLSALVPACALAHHVPYRHRIGRQEGASVEVGHVNASRSLRRSVATCRNITDWSTWRTPTSSRHSEAVMPIFIDRGAPLRKPNWVRQTGRSTLEAATSVRSSSLFEPMMRTSGLPRADSY